MQLSRLRTEAGLTIEELAELSGVSAAEVRQWERDAHVPRRHRIAVRWTLWSVKRDRSLEASGLPECLVIAKLAEGEDPAVADAIAEHLETCEVCEARSAFVLQHVEPMPPVPGGFVVRVMDRVSRLSGWQQSAFAGAAIVVILGGVGVLFFLGMGLINRSLSQIAGAFGLLTALVLSGGAGGLAHHWTRGLRATGTPGTYVSGVLTMNTYLAVLLGLVWVAGATVGWDVVGEDLRDMTTTAEGWIIMVACGTLFGLVFAHTLRENAET